MGTAAHERNACDLLKADLGTAFPRCTSCLSRSFDPSLSVRALERRTHLLVKVPHPTMSTLRSNMR